MKYLIPIEANSLHIGDTVYIDRLWQTISKVEEHGDDMSIQIWFEYTSTTYVFHNNDEVYTLIEEI